jgi:hypothetical protein
VNTSEFYQQIWQDYIKMTPQAEAIEGALRTRGETVLNDHIAFRTFNQGPAQLAALEPLILALGYKRFEPYYFAGKKLDAMGYTPPSPDLPRIFISELRVEELSAESQAILQPLIGQMPADTAADASVFWRGRAWLAPTFADYKMLAAESEYAAWLSIIGLRVNHFTISINALAQMSEVAELNEFVEALGFNINASGGRVKGSPAVLLEQSSTLASTQEFEFADGERHEVTTCYYEFAKRYCDDAGQLYQGFVAASADKIFESTHSQS